MSPRRLYMDNAATSFPKPREVLGRCSDYAAELGAGADTAHTMRRPKRAPRSPNAVNG